MDRRLRGDAGADSPDPGRPRSSGPDPAAGRAARGRDAYPDRGPDERRDPRLRARPQRQQDRGGQAGAAALEADRLGLDRGHPRPGQRRDRRLRDQRRSGRSAADAAPHVATADGMDALRRRPRRGRDLDRDRVDDVPVLRGLQPHHGLPARRDHRGHALRPGRLPPRHAPERGRLRLLLRAALLHLRGLRHPVRRHLRGHARGRPRDQQPGGAHPRPGRGGPGARAAHGRAVRDEPRAGEHPRRRRAARRWRCGTSRRYSAARS